MHRKGLVHWHVNLLTSALVGVMKQVIADIVK